MEDVERGGPSRRLSRLGTLRRAVSSYFIPRGRFKKLLEIAESDNEADVYRRNYGHRVFTQADWAQHRRPGRYARHLALILVSKIFRALILPVISVMLVAVGVGIYETLLEGGELPPSWPHVTLTLGQGFQFISFALSLLLVFRTNSAYARWWEARTLWGSLTNRTRDFVRQSLTFFPHREGKLREAALLWTAALPYVLKAHLREGTNLEAELEGILTREEIDAILGATHRPGFVLCALSQILAAAELHPILRQRMDTNLTAFEDTIGGCERILRTPIPQSYTRHTSRFLMIWLLIMPSTIWAAYSWGAVLLSGLFAYLMLGIDEIGVQIEEPFGVLPLASFCATIERNLREMHYSAEESKHAALPWLATHHLMDDNELSSAPLSDSDEDGRGSGASVLSTPLTSPDKAAPIVAPIAGRLDGLSCVLNPNVHCGMANDNNLMKEGASCSTDEVKPASTIHHHHHTCNHHRASPERFAFHTPYDIEHPHHHHAVPVPYQPGLGNLATSNRHSHASLKDELEGARPASFPRAAHWEPPKRSWFGGRWNIPN